MSPKPVLLAVSVSCGGAPDAVVPRWQSHDQATRRLPVQDYPRFGLPILVLYGVLVVFYIPLLWSL